MQQVPINAGSQSTEDLAERFAPHGAVTSSGVGNYLEAAARNFHAVAQWVDKLPRSREKSNALTRMEEALFHVNACILRSGVSVKGGQLMAPAVEMVDPEPVGEVKAAPKRASAAMLDDDGKPVTKESLEKIVAAE